MILTKKLPMVRRLQLTEWIGKLRGYGDSIPGANDLADLFLAPSSGEPYDPDPILALSKSVVSAMKVDEVLQGDRLYAAVADRFEVAS